MDTDLWVADQTQLERLGEHAGVLGARRSRHGAIIPSQSKRLGLGQFQMPTKRMSDKSTRKLGNMVISLLAGFRATLRAMSGQPEPQL